MGHSCFIPIYGMNYYHEIADLSYHIHNNENASGHFYLDIGSA
jgi:hypothetical protein